MARQRQLLNCKLGLDVAAKFGMDTSSLFSNDDLIANMEKPECADRVCSNLKVCVIGFHPVWLDLKYICRDQSKK